MPVPGLFTTPSRKQQPPIGTPKQGNAPGTSHISNANSLASNIPSQPTSATAFRASSGNNKADAMIITTDAAKRAKLTQLMQALSDDVLSFTFKHATAPSTHADNNMAADLKTRLLDLATTTTASRIMANQNTRYFLVAKLILVWIVTEVFCESTFFGFDSVIDATVQSMRGNIYADTPVSVRKLFLTQIASSFIRLGKSMEFDPWMIDLANKRATELWHLVGPLLKTRSTSEWADLYTFVLNAHEIALMIHSDETEFQFKFHKTNTLFDEVNMLNVDPEFRQMPGPAVMKAGGLVRLGALPQVLTRVTSPAGQTAEQTLLKGGVLIALPGNK